MSTQTPSNYGHFTNTYTKHESHALFMLWQSLAGLWTLSTQPSLLKTGILGKSSAFLSTCGLMLLQYLRRVFTKEINPNWGMGRLHKLSHLCRPRSGKDISVPDPSHKPRRATPATHIHIWPYYARTRSDSLMYTRSWQWVSKWWQCNVQHA